MACSTNTIGAGRDRSRHVSKEDAIRVYIAGPMRGHQQFNFPAFDECRDYLRSLGWKPISPADMDREKGFDPTAPDHDPQTGYDFDVADALRRDFDAISQCDGIVFLPGWAGSAGANAERVLGQALGIRAYVYEPGVPDFLRAGERLQETSWENLAGWKAALVRDPAIIFHGQRLGDMGTEQTISDPKTGGKKGRKLARPGLIPVAPLMELARLYGAGSLKYEDRNWEKGYDWSLSFDALFRHAYQFWGGQSVDPETGVHHLAAVAWHAFALMLFEDEGLGTDDRSALLPYARS